MTVICAWCQKVIDQDDPGTGVSHGICVACINEQLAEFGFTDTYVRPIPEGKVRDLYVTYGGEAGSA